MLSPGRGDMFIDLEVRLYLLAPGGAACILKIIPQKYTEE
jgi:hypothetical protein